MDLGITDAAALVGKSARTLRHMAKTGTLQARRDGGQWRIDRDALLRAFPGAADARAQQVEIARETLTRALDRGTPTSPETGRGWYSVVDMHTWRIGVEVARALDTRPGLVDARAAMQHALRTLADGCHQFDAAMKIDRFAAARSHACAALADVLLAADGDAELAALAERIERDLLGALRKVSLEPEPTGVSE